MCEICVIARDKIADDADVTARQYKRGDVVEVMEDGADWGRETMRNPLFRIIRIAMTVDEARAAFLSNGAPADPRQPGPILRARSASFDLDAVTEAQDFAADDTRAVAVLDLSTVDLGAVAVAKPVE